MKACLRRGTLAFALLGGAAMAWAQPGSTPPELQDGVVGRGNPQVRDEPNVTKLRLTEAQKSTIVASVRKANKSVQVPASFELTIGASVPPALELYLLPDDALVEVPAAKSVKYTEVDSQLVLVDPTTMRVVDVIAK